MPTKDILDSLHKVFFDTQKRKPENGKEIARYEELLNEAITLIQSYKDEAKKAELDAIREKIKELGISAAELGFNIPVEGSGSRSGGQKGKGENAPAPKITIRYKAADEAIHEIEISPKGPVPKDNPELKEFLDYAANTHGIKRPALDVNEMSFEKFIELFAAYPAASAA